MNVSRHQSTADFKSLSEFKTLVLKSELKTPLKILFIINFETPTLF